jgi:hypothetical protein
MELVPFSFQFLKEVINPIERTTSFKEQGFFFTGKLRIWFMDVNAIFGSIFDKLFFPPPVCRLVPRVDCTF